MYTVHTFNIQFEQVTYKNRISITSLSLGGVEEGHTGWDVPCTNTHRHSTKITSATTKQDIRHTLTHDIRTLTTSQHTYIHDAQDNYTYKTRGHDGVHATSDL